MLAGKRSDLNLKRERRVVSKNLAEQGPFGECTSFYEDLSELKWELTFWPFGDTCGRVRYPEFFNHSCRNTAYPKAETPHLIR